MAKDQRDALLAALVEGRTVNDPARPSPFPPSVRGWSKQNPLVPFPFNWTDMDVEAQRAVESLQQKAYDAWIEEETRSFQEELDHFKSFDVPVLQDPVHIAALPEALADILGIAPEEEEVPQSFDAYLEDIPLEQAHVMQQAYLDQLNLAPAIAAMQQNLDEFAAAQLEAERGRLAAEEAMPLPTRSPVSMPLPTRSPFSMPLPVRSPISMPLPTRSPVSMALPTRSPVSMPLPTRSPLSVVPEQVARTPVPLELAPFVDYDIPEEDPFNAPIDEPPVPLLSEPLAPEPVTIDPFANYDPFADPLTTDFISGPAVPAGPIGTVLGPQLTLDPANPFADPLFTPFTPAEEEPAPEPQNTIDPFLNYDPFADPQVTALTQGPAVSNAALTNLGPQVAAEMIGPITDPLVTPFTFSPDVEVDEPPPEPIDLVGPIGRDVMLAPMPIDLVGPVGKDVMLAPAEEDEPPPEQDPVGVPAAPDLAPQITMMPNPAANLEHINELDQEPLTEQDIADIAAAEAALSPFSGLPPGSVLGHISPALAISTTLNMPVNNPFNAFETAHLAGQQTQAPFGSALNPEGNLSIMASMPGTADIVSMMSAMSGMPADDHDAQNAMENYSGPLGIGAAISAANVSADPFGADPFSNASLGFDPVSDPISTSMDDVTAPAGAEDGTDDESESAPTIGAPGLGITGPTDADVSPDPSSTDGPDGPDAAAADVSGPSDGGSGGGTSGSPSNDDGFGPSDMGWMRGGRVARKGLGAKRRGKANGGPAGLAAEPPMTDGMTDETDPEQKVPKAEAQYQDKPRAGRMCGDCAHFLPEQGSCEIVKGRISPEGWSRYFEPAMR